MLKTHSLNRQDLKQENGEGKRINSHNINGGVKGGKTGLSVKDEKNVTAEMKRGQKFPMRPSADK